MSWQRFRDRYLVTPVHVEHTVPPADIVPGFTPADIVELDDTPAARELESAARLTEALRLIHAVLEEERRRPEGCRNVGRFDLALDLRSILRPSAPGSEVLREVPPVGVRYAVGGYIKPVSPRRAS